MSIKKDKRLRLAVFLEELAEAELAFEAIKQRLASVPGFRPETLFSKIAESDSRLTIAKLQKYVEQSMPVTELELHELFCRFDWSRNGRISKEDFCRELRPYNYQRIASRPSIKTTKPNVQVQCVFLQLIREYLQRWRIHEVCREELSHMIPYRAFDEIAVYRRGHIGTDELALFMERNEVPANQKQLWALLKAFKRQHYSYVTLEVFCENLWPIEFGYYNTFEAELRRMQENISELLNRESQTIRRQSCKEQSALARTKMKEEHRIEAQLAAERGRLRRNQDTIRSKRLSRTAASQLYLEQAVHQTKEASRSIAEPMIATFDTERLDTPYFQRQPGQLVPKISTSAAAASIELECREGERYREHDRQRQVLSEIKTQALLRKSQLELTSRLLQRRINFNFPRCFTPSAELAMGRNDSLIPLSHMPIEISRSQVQHNWQQRPAKDAPATQLQNSNSQAPPKDATRKSSYSFGDEHLRVYHKLPTRTQKRVRT